MIYFIKCGLAAQSVITAPNNPIIEIKQGSLALYLKSVFGVKRIRMIKVKYENVPSVILVETWVGYAGLLENKTGTKIVNDSRKKIVNNGYTTPVVRGDAMLLTGSDVFNYIRLVGEDMMVKQVISKSDFSVIVKDNIVLIIDLELGGLSVTNNADEVIKLIVASGLTLDDKLVVYRDSMGEFDIMLVKDGEFVDFDTFHKEEWLKDKFGCL